ncbi:MAG: NAD(P)-dependent oxidoreductase [Bacteroidetes bacterium]|nr:NAD(P)-dependent oxidoreductase [Bacteroidota bacterium]
MKILITGGGGFFGEFLNRILSKDYQVLTLYHKNFGSSNLFNSQYADITDYKLMSKIFYEFKPDVVIHSAALADPILCKKLDSRIVYNVNVNSTNNIAELCDSIRAKLIYISTDLVYAGYRSSMLDENSKLVPASLYAETKLMAEVKIKETFDNFIILRQALLFSLSKYNSNNYFQFMFGSLKKSNEIKVFNDQFRTPISVLESARAIKELVKKNIKKEIVNLGGSERVSRVELAELLCEIAAFDKNLLNKISMNDIPDYVGVKDVSLNTDKLSSFGIKIKSLEDSVREVIQYFKTSVN